MKKKKGKKSQLKKHTKSFNKVKTVLTVEKKEVEPSNYYDLPLKDINRDLVGMLIFAVLSFVIIMFLNKYNIGLSNVISWFKF